MIFKKKKKTPTPNCSICKWRSREEVIYERGEGYACVAQAYSSVVGVYNTKECRSLFEKYLSGNFEEKTTEQEHSSSLINDVNEVLTQQEKIKNILEYKKMTAEELKEQCQLCWSMPLKCSECDISNEIKIRRQER